MSETFVACTRFSDATVEENQRWREINQHMGCIYGVSRPIKKTVPRGSWIYVIEMNNTGRGRIEGVGLIRNINRNGKPHKIYSDSNYNLEIYHGKYRLSRSELLAHQVWCVPRERSLLCMLEDKLFRGKGHLKRGWGVTILPPALTGCSELALARNIGASFKHKYAHIPE